MKLSADKKKFVDEFLQQPLIARMATADIMGNPHVVPVWFGWDGESLWISSFSSTRKNSELEQNPKISVAIDTDGDKTAAVILEGPVELISHPRDLIERQALWIYTRYMGNNGVLAQQPQNWIKDPENCLIKLTPANIITWQY